MKAIETLDKPIYLPARAPHNRVLYEYNRTTDGKEYPGRETSIKPIRIEIGRFDFRRINTHLDQHHKGQDGKQQKLQLRHHMTCCVGLKFNVIGQQFIERLRINP